MIPQNTKSIISIVLEIRSNELPNRKRYTNISGDKYAYKSKSNCKLIQHVVEKVQGVQDQNLLKEIGITKKLCTSDP